MSLANWVSLNIFGFACETSSTGSECHVGSVGPSSEWVSGTIPDTLLKKDPSVESEGSVSE